MPQFKLFNCYFRTARYNEALELAKAHVKDENLEDRVEWLVNLSKILYKNKIIHVIAIIKVMPQTRHLE